MEYLLKFGANPNDVDGKGKNSVQIAQALQNLQMTDFLIKNGGSLRPVSGAKFKIRSSNSLAKMDDRDTIKGD